MIFSAGAKFRVGLCISSAPEHRMSTEKTRIRDVQALPEARRMSILEIACPRASRRGGRVADRGGLLSRCRGHTLPRVRIPPSPQFSPEPLVLKLLFGNARLRNSVSRIVQSTELKKNETEFPKSTFPNRSLGTRGNTLLFPSTLLLSPQKSGIPYLTEVPPPACLFPFWLRNRYDLLPHNRLPGLRVCRDC